MKIRVCHFVNIITGKADGVYAHLKMIFKYVNPDKFQYYLVFQGNPEIEKEISELGVKVYVIKSLNKKISLKTIIEFYSFIKEENIDIIHTHFLKPYAVGGIVNIFLKRKMIFNYHGLFINNLYNSVIEKIIYRISHLLIYFFKAVNTAVVPSFSSKKILMQETKLFPTINVYYNGYDINKSTEEKNIVNYLLKLRKSYYLIAVVARLYFEKRIDIALEILDKISETHKNVFFVFFGDGPLEQEMKDLAKTLRIEDKTKFLGYVSNACIYLKYFDLSLLTSDREGMPITLWEAMASSLPIIASDVGGLKEIIEKENCGIIYSPGNINDAADAISNLLMDKKKREQMGNNGFLAVKDKYNSETFSMFFENLYTSLIKKG